MKKIAIVNQRYGLEVNGGSELYTREIAERLCRDYEVHVLTTCALEYTDWANYYPEGVDTIHGVTVHRFPVKNTRNKSRFAEVHKVMEATAGRLSEAKGQEWLEEMGPFCPELVHYIDVQRDSFDVFIVVTYLYYPAVKSLELIGDKAIFIPTAHDEPFLYFPIYRTEFCEPAGFIFLTSEEKKLICDTFDISGKIYDVMGVGVDLPKYVEGKTFKEKYGIEDYLIYVGRIDVGKGAPDLFRDFIRYKEHNPSGLKLVLMGKSEIEIPQHPDILYLGFVSEEDKFSGVKGARALVLPSKFESLSISVLESMALETPVIVNGNCAVLKGHCVKSRAGLYYTNYYEFEGCVNYLHSHEEEYKCMKENASSYIKENYDWDIIIKRFKELIEKISDGGKT